MIWSAVLLGGTDRSPLQLNFDHYSEWLAAGAGVALVLVGLLLFLLGAVTPVPADEPRSFRRYARGMGAWGAASTGVFLGVGFSASFVLGLARALDVRAQTELIYRVAYSWGITVCLVLAGGLISLVGSLRTARVLKNLPVHEYQTVSAAALGAPGGSWPKRIARAMSVARLKLHVATMILVYAGAGLAMTLVTAIEMLGETNTPIARDLYQHLGWFGYLSQRLRAPGEASWWVLLLTNTGTYALIGLAGLLFFLGRRSLRAEESRRGANVVWDVISFWPHAAHPFVPLAYLQFAVHDLRRRIDFHLNPPADITDPDKPRPARVVLSAHSQGSLIAFATVLWLGTADRERTALVTYGSQLRSPIPAVSRASSASGWSRRCWPRWTAGGSTCTERPTRSPGQFSPGIGRGWPYRPADPDPPTSHRVGGPPGEQDDSFDGTTGRRESGHDWRVLDPRATDARLQRTSLTALGKHSGYPATADCPNCQGV